MLLPTSFLELAKSVGVVASVVSQLKVCFFFFFYDLLFPQILDFEILIDLDNFLDTVSGVAGPLLILEKVKVGDFALLPYIS